MADNTTLSAGSGGNVVRTDDIAGVHHPTSKITLGADGVDDGFVGSANPLPALIRSEQVDDAAFTPGTSRVVIIGAEADETAPDSVDEGDGGGLRMTLARGLHSNLRNASGTELGVAAAPVRTDPTGTTAQPITDNSGSLTVDNAGTFAVQESGGALTALQLIDDAVYTDGTGTPSKALGVAGTDGTNPQIIKTDAAGELQVDVLTLPAIPAGTNNIGDVDVLTLPALPAGTNNIGDVDVLSIAAGDNNIGNVDVVTLPALPAGGNTIGDVTVSGSALTALQLIDDPVFSDDAAFTPATSKVQAVGFLADQTAPDSVDEGDIGAARMTLDRYQLATVEQESSSIRAAGVALTPKFAVIDEATSGDNTLVAAVASKKIRVLALWMMSAGTVTAKFQTAAAGAYLSGGMAMTAQDGLVLPYNPLGWFETVAGDLLNLELNAAVQVSGGLTYCEV